jgi:transposase InsO family protein
MYTSFASAAASWITRMDLQQTLESWRDDYNHHRPHSSLADVPPVEFRAGGAFIPDRSRLQFARG